MVKDLEALLSESTNTPEILRFYDDSVTLYYDSALHAYYTVEEGQRILVPGVTTVTAMKDKPALVQWAANSTVVLLKQSLGLGAVLPVEQEAYDKLFNDARFNFRQISKSATDVGTIAHEWLEGLIKDAITFGELDTKVELPSNPQASNCVTAAVNWFQKHNFRPIYSERKLYSKKYGYAGTVDWLGQVTGCGDFKCCPFTGDLLCLGDFKTSKALYDDYRLQTAAYQAAIQEELGLSIGLRLLLRLDKETGEFETMVTTWEDFEADFDAFLGLLATYNWQKQIDLNRKYDKAVEKAAAKAAKPIKRRAPRKPVIKDCGAIPVEV